MENQRVFLTKKLLENALIKLLKKKSLYNISIRELCDEASINRSTFYKHFSSQFELFNYMEDSLLKGIDSIFGQTNDDEEILEEKLIKILKYLKENKEFSKLLLTNNFDPTFPKKLFSLKGINNAIKLTIHENENESVIKLVTSFIISGSFAIIRTWLDEDCIVKEDILAKLLSSITIKY